MVQKWFIALKKIALSLFFFWLLEVALSFRSLSIADNKWNLLQNPALFFAVFAPLIPKLFQKPIYEVDWVYAREDF